MSRIEALVIGGGPSGLAVSYGLQGDTLVLEREAAVGGLCRSIHHEGSVFDIGGHSFHTPHPEVLDLVNRITDGGLFTQKRDARIYTYGTLIPYPFQKFFDQIPNQEVVDACEKGLRGAIGDVAAPKNFKEFILQKFGQGIADHFMLPYNRKLWARDIEQISCEWITERVAAPKGEIEKFDTGGGKRKPLQSDTNVSYPVKGGFEEIYKSFVPRLPALKVSSAVVQVNPKARVATTQQGEEFQWKFLVSTIPLPILVRIVEGCPVDVVAAADCLEYMSLRVELLKTDHQLETSIQRIYVSDPQILPHKIVLNHNSSDYLRAQPCHAIMAEVSISPDKPIDVDQITPSTVGLLCDLGILKSHKDITWQGHIDVKYAYPVYTHERPALVKTIKDWMSQVNIYTLGRFGDWEYINSDQCVMNGLILAHKLRQSYPIK